MNPHRDKKLVLKIIIGLFCFCLLAVIVVIIFSETFNRNSTLPVVSPLNSIEPEENNSTTVKIKMNYFWEFLGNMEFSKPFFSIRKKTK